MTRLCGGLICLVVLGAGATLGAQRLARTPPDLQGAWSNGTVTPLQRPPVFEGRTTMTPEEAATFERTFFDRLLNGIASDDDRQLQNDFNEIYQEPQKVDRLRTSLIIDPPNGRIPPLVDSARTRPQPRRSFDDPESLTISERCLLPNTAGVPLLPPAVGSPYYQIVQTPSAVLIHAETFGLTRIIRLDGAHQPASIRSWLGDSIGHWEGADLVVDTTNFRPHSRFQGSTERLHLVERFTRIDEQTLRYQFTAEDPDTWQRPWTAEVLFRATDAQLFETACHEGDHDRELTLRGARFDERAPTRTP